MTSYVEGALVKDETIVYIGRTSLWSMWHLIFFGVVLLPIAFGLILLVIAWVRYKTTELAITTRRIIVKKGLISRSTVEINLHKVESVMVEQSLFGRLFDFGTLVVSGAGVPQAPVIGVRAPMAFRKAFVEAQDQARHGA